MLANRFFKQIELGFWRLIVGSLKFSKPFSGFLRKRKEELKFAHRQRHAFNLQLLWALSAWFVGMAIGFFLFS